jgi:hypothetical protein
MHYFFVTIQYYIKERSVIFSVVFKSVNFLTEAEIIEKAFMKKITDHFYLGFRTLYDIIYDRQSQIIAYSNLTKQQYERYKIKNPVTV